MPKKSNEQKYAELSPEIIGETIERMRKFRDFSSRELFLRKLEKCQFSGFAKGMPEFLKESILEEIEEGVTLSPFPYFVEICTILEFSVDGALAIARKISNLNKRLEADLQRDFDKTHHNMGDCCNGKK